MLHVHGLESLLELRGPWQQKSYAGKTVFLEHRIMLVRGAPFDWFIGLTHSGYKINCFPSKDFS